MKAKSWKKFVKDDEPKKEKFSFGVTQEGEENKQEEADKEELLSQVIAKNETLSSLVKEREQLEQQMAQLTGQDIGTENGARPFHFAEIPSITEKQKAEKRREERRKRELQLLKKRQASDKPLKEKLPFSSNLSEASSNLSPIDSQEVITGVKKSDKDKRKKGDSLTGKRAKNRKSEITERFDFEKNKRKNKEGKFSFERNKKENERFSFDENKKKQERFSFEENKKREERLDSDKSKSTKGDRFSAEKAKAERQEYDFISKRKKQKGKTGRNDPDSFGSRFKKGKEEVSEFLSKNRKKDVDEWLIRDEKKREKAKKTLGGVKKIGSDLQKAKKQLDKLNSLASDDRFSDVFDDEFKNTLSTASNITDKITRPFDKVKKSKAVENFTEGWEKAKKKRLDASKVKKKYEEASRKLLQVDVGSFGAMQLRLDQLKAQSLFEKKENRKAEKKEESRREKRKREREEERKQERKEEEKRERKREERREARKKKKKEKY